MNKIARKIKAIPVIISVFIRSMTNTYQSSIIKSIITYVLLEFSLDVTNVRARVVRGIPCRLTLPVSYVTIYHDILLSQQPYESCLLEVLPMRTARLRALLPPLPCLYFYLFDQLISLQIVFPCRKNLLVVK